MKLCNSKFVRPLVLSSLILSGCSSTTYFEEGDIAPNTSSVTHCVKGNRKSVRVLGLPLDGEFNNKKCIQRNLDITPYSASINAQITF